MKRQDILILLAIGFVLTNVFAFLDYDGDGLNYLIDMWHLFLIAYVVFMALPMVLLYFFRRSKHRIAIAAIGFVPLIGLIIYLL